MTDYSSIPTITKGESDMDDINAWWTAVNQLRRQDEASFNAYVADNPAMGIRYHARGALGDVNSGADNDWHKQEAQRLSYMEATRLGYGTDMKQDGKMVAWNYKDWNDITNEWGKGDFWKIGTPSALNGGLMDFIEDNPFQVAAIVGSVFIPMMAPAVASALGVSNAVASGLISSGLSAVGGGDLTDIVTAGLTSWGLGELSAWADSQLGAAMESNPQLAEAQKVLDGAGVVIDPAKVDGNMIVNFANDAIPGTLDAGARVNGIGVVGAAGELNNAYNDYMGGTVTPVGSGSYDNPILDYPGGVEQNPDAGGANPLDGPTQGAIDPSRQTGGGRDGTDLNTTSPGEASDSDVWRVVNGVLVNTATGAQREAGSNMQTGVLYNGDGDVIGEDPDALVAGGAPVLPTFNQYDGTTVRGDNPLAGWDGALSGILDFGYGSNSPGTGTGQGSTDGTGVGEGNQPGVDTDPATQDPNIDPSTGLPIIIPPVVDNGGGNSYNANVPPQNMETRYEKPTYDDFQMRPLLEVPDRPLQAPMITPASNSGQASYDEWLNDYLASPAAQEGLLPMIAGKRTTGGLI